MQRLFVAIDLPDDLKKAAAGIGRELPGARRVPEEQLHLTLRFIGEVDDRMSKKIRGALAEIEGPPFSLALSGIGHFPPRGFPRVLWVGLEESPPLLELQRTIERTLVEAGIPPEEKRFSPHLTLARLRDTPPEKVALLERRYAEFSTGPFPVTAFHLYESTLTRSGALHERIATYQLEPEMP